MTDSKTKQFIENFYSTRSLENRNDEQIFISDCISEHEAKVINNLIKLEKPNITIEVGLAHGISASVICLSKKEMNINGMHYAIDPNQLTDFDSIGLNTVKNNDLTTIFTHLNGPSHLKIPELINSKINVDFAFIDGWHTFDYTLVDFFLIDKILNSGGIVAFHDGYGRSKQKVFRFLETHRNYEILKKEMLFSDNTLYKTLKMFLWRILKDPSLILSKYHWRYQIRRESGLYLFRKKDGFEPSYDFYKNF